MAERKVVASVMQREESEEVKKWRKWCREADEKGMEEARGKERSGKRSEEEKEEAEEARKRMEKMRVHIRQTRRRWRQCSRIFCERKIKYLFVPKMSNDFRDNKYNSWTVSQLKDELKKRGARLTGRKRDLQERLTYYDQNFNFILPNNASCATNDDANNFWTPHETEYRDINAHSVLPPITKNHVSYFLDRFSVHTDLGKEMYENEYLLCARMAMPSNGWIFIRGICMSQMRKSMQYVVDIKLSIVGSIESTHCECAVGYGDTAHCKHVAVLLWAIEQMVREKKIITRAVCTQQLQSFHVPKKRYFGTPVKADQMPESKNKKKAKSSRRSLDIDFLPSSAEYNNNVRNLCINFSGLYPNSNMPIFHRYEPANLYALNRDHWYFPGDRETQLLQELKLSNVTDTDIQTIELETRDQNSNKNWHEYRRYRITASNFYRCSKSRLIDEQRRMARSLLNPKPFKTKATVHGQQWESVARSLCEATYGYSIKPCGLFVSKTHAYLGASPDGLVGDDIVIEIKCPFNERFSVIDENTIPFLYKDPQTQELQLSKDHPYFYQIQGQMFVTNRYSAKLIVFTFLQFVVINIPRNDDVIREMLRGLERFYEDGLKTEIYEEFIYKNYSNTFIRE